MIRSPSSLPVGLVRKSLHKLNTDAKQVENRASCLRVVFSFLCQGIRSLRCLHAEFVERGSAFRRSGWSQISSWFFLAEGMWSLSKPPADVVSKSFQELFIFFFRVCSACNLVLPQYSFKAVSTSSRERPLAFYSASVSCSSSCTTHSDSAMKLLHVPAFVEATGNQGGEDGPYFSSFLTMLSRRISQVTQIQSSVCHRVVFFTHLPKCTWTTSSTYVGL